MNVPSPVEYAPEFTKAEKIRFVLVEISLGLGAICFKTQVLVPLVEQVSSQPSSPTVFDLSPAALMLYLVGVGFPFLVAALLAIAFGRRGIRIL